MNILHITHGLQPGNGFETYLRDYINNDKQNKHFVVVPEFKYSDIGLGDCCVITINSFETLKPIVKSFDIDLIVTHWTGPEGIFNDNVKLVINGKQFNYKVNDGVKVTLNNHPFGLIMVNELFDLPKVTVFHSEFEIPFHLTLDKYINHAVFVGRKSQKLLACDYSIIPNGVDFDRFESTGKQESITNNVVIGWSGRLEKYDHKIYQAIKADKELNAKCLFLYAGWGELDKDSKDNHVFLDQVDNVSEFLSKCDVYLYPTKVDSFGLAVVEALAMGLPTIASPVVADVVGDFCYIYQDVDDCINKLKEMIANDLSKYKPDRQALKNKYNLTNMIDSYNRLYDSLV